VDTFRFEIGERDVEVPVVGPVDRVDILVNDRNLLDVLRETELPFAVREGKPELAGGYAGLPPE
jgi:hypothetical protein